MTIGEIERKRCCEILQKLAETCDSAALRSHVIADYSDELRHRERASAYRIAIDAINAQD